jgi:peptidoglycan LD-endopeptidase LytH
VGNTGNAAFTSPHLHFGIYAAGGAIDPLPFVNPNVRKPAVVTVNRNWLRDTLRSMASVKTENRTYSANAVVFPLAASAKTYRVELPDGTITEVAMAAIQSADRTLRQAKTKRDSFLLESPQENAPRKLKMKEATTVKVLGYFGDYAFVESGIEKGWLPSTML